VTPDASEKESPSAARPEASGDGSAAAASPRASCGRVSGEQARALVQKGATLLDVRSAGEFASGHLEGARLIPHDEVGRRKGELPSGAPVVVYCRSGRRSAAAATVLRGQGFEVYDLGGMSGWSTTGDACL
jgi:rhodanese-related sulfurtransferase